MTLDPSTRYELRVRGHLDARWSGWLCDLAVQHHGDGTSTLTGPIADQAQLHGVLTRLRDLGVTLLSVRTLDDPPPPAHDNVGTDCCKNDNEVPS